MSKSKKQTPLMEQYWSVKSSHPDKIMLFRMGDFFEIFHQDAEIAAPILEIALTYRNKKSGDDTKMCGVPHHAIAGPINKLLAADYKVAICDQLEDPKNAKGLVKRGVTRILSPGMQYNPEDLEATSANYLASFDSFSLSFLDSSTGEAFFFKVSSKEEVESLMGVLPVSELVLAEEDKESYLKDKKEVSGPLVSAYDIQKEEELEISRLYPDLCSSSQRLLAYASYMQGKDILKNIQSFEERFNLNHLKLSKKLIRHLEIFETYSGDTKSSLFHSINRCKTSAGARRLKNWLCFPLMDLSEIQRRQSFVQFWLDTEKQEDKVKMKQVRSILSQMGDLERKIAKLSNPNCSPYDLMQIAQTMRHGLSLCALTDKYFFANDDLLFCHELVQKIEATIVDEPPANLRSGAFIKKGVLPELDEYIEYSTDAQSKLQNLVEREKEATQIPSLKVRYNNVFGYYLEVTNTHRDKVPEYFIRKQTLVNSERYFTEELKHIEEKVLSAKQKRQALELSIFNELKKELLDKSSKLLLMANAWAEMDIHCALAWLALEQNYCRPMFNDENKIELKSLRHPVLEQEIKNFVPNDLYLERGEHLLITGPNMAGKSTLMRQLAINILLAQIGSYVPAAKANLCLFDRIFTRIGASDSLAEGLSTFMVEMSEASDIVNHLTDKSLVILDELGRGTSTYDGMSLAQSLLEYFSAKSKLISLFATHYHELTGIEKERPNIKNVHMAISENKSRLNFLYKLRMGPANKSYGIQVAELAGLPGQITNRAKQVLKELEDKGLKGLDQLDLFQNTVAEVVSVEEEPEVLKDLKQLDPYSLSPMDALNRIVQWQKDLS